MSDSTTVFTFDKDVERPNCLLAVPKKGRLFEQCSKLLAGSGIDYHRPNRLDVAHCTNLPITLVFLPAADIATYVGEGNVDIGITGIDVVEESNVEVDTIMDLDFGRCKLCVQAPKGNFTSAEQIAGKRIVTSFPVLAKRFFDQYDTPEKKTSIKFVSGSVEAACALGLADAVVDLVETGLEVVADVIQTQAVMISSKNCKHPDIVDLVKKRVVGYMTATSYMMIQYNCSRDKLQDAIKITPGKRSPTITPLDEDNGVAVSALVLQKESSKIMDLLQSIGATDILLFSITNSRM
eukprot:gene8630-17804_t